MGVGALSSDYVTKLGSKEVRKRLRNFIPRPYDGRGCHEVTGEGESQIAQSLQEDPFCTKSIDFGKRRQVRDDNTRHAELADCELRAELDGEMAKPLQTSIVDPLNASNKVVSASITHPNLVLKREGTLMEFGSR